MNRLVNLLQIANLDKDTFWNVVKILKREISFDIVRGCGSYNMPLTPYTWQTIPSPVMKLEQTLEIESSDQIFENVTFEALKNGAEIFIYLNTCPKGDLLSWFENWSAFYESIFKTETIDIAILTLNRMMKIYTSNNIDVKIRAEKLLKRITSLVSLNYKEIQSLLPNHGKIVSEKCGNETLKRLEGRYVRISKMQII